jgi:leucyl aminopeptidase
MSISLTNEPVTEIKANVVVVGCFQDEAFSEDAQAVDAATRGVLGRLQESGEITGKHGELTTLLAPAGIAASQVVVLGLGRRDKLDQGAVFRAVAAAAKSIAAKSRPVVAWYLPTAADVPVLATGICAAMVGCQGQDLYRAELKLNPIAEMKWRGDDTQSLETGVILGECINLARELVNRPSSDIYPESFAERAREIAGREGLDVEIWDKERLSAERCGALLAVAQGSVRPPRMVILRYTGSTADAPTIALVGKGVTFDSGGLSLKPSDSMKTMKCDMAGAATVLAVMQAVARLKLPVNVIGLAGLVENMIGGNAFKLGDVLRARNGKTIEVLNTDAEGRLVLADVLDVAVERKADCIIDLATLTGACVVALGNDVAGLMTNDQILCDKVAAAAKTCGEPVWQLPMFPDYAEQIKSNVADIKNTGDGRWGGAITAAKFLEEFVQDKPWVHIDIAGPAFLESAKSWIDAGATGAFVRTLVELLAAASRNTTTAS